jgi:hypothetical protein
MTRTQKPHTGLGTLGITNVYTFEWKMNRRRWKMILSDEDIELIRDALDHEIDSINTTFMLSDDEVRQRDHIIELSGKIRDNTVVLVTPQRRKEMIKPEVDLMVSNPEFLEIL